jgi:hypothetical protein
MAAHIIIARGQAWIGEPRKHAKGLVNHPPESSFPMCLAATLQSDPFWNEFVGTFMVLVGAGIGTTESQLKASLKPA